MDEQPTQLVKETRLDWAAEIKCLLDEDYPDAELIILVCDNLNTHTLGALYEAFPPAEAKRLGYTLHTQARQLAQCSRN